MPKYFTDKIAGCYIYFTSKCILEAIHAHANDKGPVPKGSAKFWVYEDGTTKVVDKGNLSTKQIVEIQEHILLNIERVKDIWADFAHDGDVSKINYMRKR